MQGIGDVVAKVTETLGIPKCEPCKKRQEKLNALFPFKQKLTEEDIAFLSDVFSWYKGLPIPMDKVLEMQRCEVIWLRVYNVKGTPCKTCGSEYQNNYMNKLNQLLT
jgi:hypothetical protein